MLLDFQSSINVVEFLETYLCLVSTESSLKLTVSIPFSPLTGFFIMAVLTPKVMFPGLLTYTAMPCSQVISRLVLFAA